MNESLNDVRKAYRYLFQYQRKILDSIQLLTSEYKIINVRPKFSNKPNFNSFKFKDWSWDYLPLYQPLFKFDISQHQNDNSLYKELAIYITSDTGHFINETDNSNNRIDLNRFASTEESESVLIIMVCAANSSFNYRERIGLNNKMIKQNIESHFQKDKVIAKKYNLSVFNNEDSIISLREDFRKFAREKDISVKIF